MFETINSAPRISWAVLLLFRSLLPNCCHSLELTRWRALSLRERKHSRTPKI